MSNEGKNISGSLILDLRKRWRHVQAKNSYVSKLGRRTFCYYRYLCIYSSLSCSLFEFCVRTFLVIWALKHPTTTGVTQGLLPRKEYFSTAVLPTSGCWKINFPLSSSAFLLLWCLHFPLSSSSSFALLELKVWHILHVLKSLLSALILEWRSMEYQKTWLRSRMMAQESEGKSFPFILRNVFWI